MEKGFKRGWILGGIILLVILTGCMIGGSYYMLNFSLTPNARIRAKDAIGIYMPIILFCALG